MGLVNSLKFNYKSGAIITDEEFFIGGRRRVHTTDNLQSLITEEMSNELNLEAVFGGAGNLSVVNDIITKIKSRLQQQYNEYKRTGNENLIFKNVEDISRTAMKVFQEISHDKVNKKLFGLLGFTIDDFNRGYFEREGVKYEIKDDKMITKAMDIIMMKSSGMKDIQEVEAIIIGTDEESGFNAYDFYGGMTHLYISTSLYNSVGAGSTTTSLAFANMINSLELDQRRNGVDKVFGIVELIKITNQAAIKNSEIGGYYDIIYIDGNGKNHGERFFDINGEKTQLLKEIVGAFDNNLIQKDVCFELVERIVFSGIAFDFNEAEAAMFNNSSDKEKLNLFLRGYKV